MHFLSQRLTDQALRERNDLSFRSLAEYLPMDWRCQLCQLSNNSHVEPSVVHDLGLALQIQTTRAMTSGPSLRA